MAEVDITGFGFTKISNIGRGQTARCQTVCDDETGLHFVAKCVGLTALDDHNKDLALQEVSLLQTLAHPNIVAYHDSFVVEGANTLVILMEHCQMGDMHRLIKRQLASGGCFAEVQVVQWLQHIASALEYMHSVKVLHRDLKSSNIFLDKGAGGEALAKLGDFGLSRILSCTADAAQTLVGTPYYMSPEVCQSEPYGYKSDIWSLGCVLYELCMLRHAFHSSSLQEIVNKIRSGLYDPLSASYSPEMAGLISELLEVNPESRPSASEVLSRPHVIGYLQVAPTPVEDWLFFVTPPGTPVGSDHRNDLLEAGIPGQDHHYAAGGTPPGSPNGTFHTCIDQDLLRRAS